MPEKNIRRADVWWIDFDPTVGGEIGKTRPAIIISNDMANKHLNRVLAVPLTSNIGRLYPGEAYVTINGQQSKAMSDQLTTVSKLRLRTKIGTLTSDDMRSVEFAIRQHIVL